MNKLAISIAIGASALFVSAATAAPITNGQTNVTSDSAVEQVRLVCDEYGRCYRSRGGRRVVIQQQYGETYNYQPRERYIEQRGYYNDEPRVGFRAPGVSIGIGSGY